MLANMRMVDVRKWLGESGDELVVKHPAVAWVVDSQWVS
jgi:hypothetical protein